MSLPYWDADAALSCQLWFNNLVFHHLARCQQVMLLFVQKRFDFQTFCDYFRCWHFSPFKFKSMLHVQHVGSQNSYSLFVFYYMPKDHQECVLMFPYVYYSSFYEFIGLCSLQVVTNKDTLVKLLAKHTGNVSRWKLILLFNNKRYLNLINIFAITVGGHSIKGDAKTFLHGFNKGKRIWGHRQGTFFLFSWFLILIHQKI